MVVKNIDIEKEIQIPKFNNMFFAAFFFLSLFYIMHETLETERAQLLNSVQGVKLEKVKFC